jgi:hypothetical protein
MTGIELEEVHRVLVECFNPRSFAIFLRTKMDKVLEHIAGPGSFINIVFEVLSVAEQEGWDSLLIARVAEVRKEHREVQLLAQKYGRALVGQFPAKARNPSIRDAYRELGLAPPGFPTEAELGGLEKLIDPHNQMVNMAVWVERAVQHQGSVCRVEVDGEPMGTGFLVGPRAVLTNHHVVASVLPKGGLKGRVQLRFDYKRLRDGTILSGTLVDVERVLDHSPATDGELMGHPERVDPTNDYLDFALLQTAGSPGDEPIRVAGAVDGKQRGWIPFSTTGQVNTPDPFAPDQPVLIAQHPLGQPLALAIEWRSMIGLNANSTRVRHRTNTQAGSSGSPCFDRNWNLIALHHYGDSKFGHDPRFNQGVPIAVIRRRLSENGHAEALKGDRH